LTYSYSDVLNSVIHFIFGSDKVSFDNFSEYFKLLSDYTSIYYEKLSYFAIAKLGEDNSVIIWNKFKS